MKSAIRNPKSAIVLSALLIVASIVVVFAPVQCDKAMAATTTVQGPASTVVTTTGTQIISNKQYTLPQINDTSADHQYIFAVSELVADRTITLPLLTGDDTPVFANFAATLANKTVASPTVTGTWDFSSCTVTLPDTNVTAAKLAAAVQDVIPYITITGANDADGTGSATIQVKDAAGNNLAQRFRLTTWIAETDFDTAPDAQMDFSVTTGTQKTEVTADAEYVVDTDATGLVAMNINAGGAKTVYVMAELDGRIYSSGAINITVP